MITLFEKALVAPPKGVSPTNAAMAAGSKKAKVLPAQPPARITALESLSTMLGGDCCGGGGGGSFASKTDSAAATKVSPKAKASRVNKAQRAKMASLSLSAPACYIAPEAIASVVGSEGNGDSSSRMEVLSVGGSVRSHG